MSVTSESPGGGHEAGCTLCPRNCGAVRREHEGFGYCRMGTMPVAARAALHFWEEPCI